MTKSFERGGRWLGAIPILGLFMLWQGASNAGLISPFLLPPPTAVVIRLVTQLGDLVFLQHVGITLMRLLAGFIIAVLIGVSLGLVAAANRAADSVLRPLVQLLAPIPKVALYPAFLLTLGFGSGSKIALVATDAMFPILLATYAGARLVDPKLVWSLRAAGASSRRAAIAVLLPAAMPSILTGCRIGLIISCVVVFLAEMITSSDGLGHLLVRAARSFQTIDMFVPIVLISLLGLAANVGLTTLRRRLLRGFPEEA